MTSPSSSPDRSADTRPPKEMPQLSQRSTRVLNNLIASTLVYGQKYDGPDWETPREKMLTAIDAAWNHIAELEAVDD